MKKAKSYSEASTQPMWESSEGEKKGLEILLCLCCQPAALRLWLYFVQERRNSKETVLENSTLENPS